MPLPRNSAERWGGDLAAGLLLAVFCLVRYWSSLKDFWLFDDPSILVFALSNSPLDYFTRPDVWRQGTVSNFTPWVVLSFDADLALFGLDPKGFHSHQLASLCLLGIAAYVLLRQWLSKVVSLVSVGAFLSAVPTSVSAQLLMERHYIEGLLFSVLAVLLYLRSLRTGGATASILGGFFYFLACTAKEIYVPLILAAPLLPAGSFRQRLVRLLPWCAVLGLYLPWRWHMLGTLVGGYGYDIVWPGDYLRFVPRVYAAMTGSIDHSPLWASLLAVSTIAALGVLWRADRSAAAKLALAAPLVLLPVFPVSPVMTSRYVWLFAFYLSVLHAGAWECLSRRREPASRRTAFLWGTLLAGMLLYTSLHSDRVARQFIEQQRIEGAFVLEQGDSGDCLIRPAAPGWYYTSLGVLRRRFLNLPPGPRAAADADVLCLKAQDAATAPGGASVRFDTVWHFDRERKFLMPEPIESYIAKNCAPDVLGEVRSSAPLQAVVNYGENTFSWEFGPYGNGSYTLLLGENAETAFPLPRAGRRSVWFGDETLFLMLRYTAPEGWRAYSPRLELAIRGGRGSLTWQHAGPGGPRP